LSNNTSNAIQPNKYVTVYDSLRTLFSFSEKEKKNENMPGGNVGLENQLIRKLTKR
jgi:hypothetical protein